MKQKIYNVLLVLVFTSSGLLAQKAKQGHVNINKFRQLKQELPTPNSQRTASGKPGKDYTQQKVDYKMDIVLDDDNRRISGSETITYHNNSSDALEYLWVQLDKNMRAKDSKTTDIQPNRIPINHHILLVYRMVQYHTHQLLHILQILLC